MILVAGGDSFIWGIDLTDHKFCSQGGHSMSTWPALLAQQHNLEYICTATPGGSNDSVVRSIVKICEEIDNPNDIVVAVQWTFPWRFGFKYIDPIGWYDFDLHIINNNEFSNTAARKTHNTLKQYGVTDFADKFYKVIGTTEYWPVYNTVKEILLLQGYLKSKNIPYLFTAADNCIVQNFTIEQPADVYVKNLYDQIDQTNWFWFPKGSEEHETVQPRGFYQWAMENKYSVGVTNHPLELAHLDASKLIKEQFNELVEKSI